MKVRLLPTGDDLTRRIQWWIAAQESLGRKLSPVEKKIANRWYNYGETPEEFVRFVLRRR
jgi:hypothetical protein